MKEQKNIEFTNLASLLDILEENPDKYKTRMLDKDTVSVGDIYIRRYYNIDPTNISEQYAVIAGNCEYIILPNNKIWAKAAGQENLDFVRVNYSTSEAGMIWYQVAIIHQHAINKNLKKFYKRPARREFMLIMIASVLASLVTTGTNRIMNKKQNDVQNQKEIPADTIQKPINPTDTIMYNQINQYVK